MKANPFCPSALTSANFSLIRAVPFPVSPPNSFLIRSSVSEMTSTTSAMGELRDFDNIICIFGLNSDLKRVPSPMTRHESFGDKEIRPVPGLPSSAARATGTLQRLSPLVASRVQDTYCYPFGERRSQQPFASCSSQRLKMQLDDEFP